jgi:hypothetical protein
MNKKKVKIKEKENDALKYPSNFGVTKDLP